MLLHLSAPGDAHGPDAARQQRLAMGASLAVAIVMLVGKLAAYRLTGSTAILSDALESVVHLAATAMVGFSLWYAAQPPDPSHPYGHGKIAYFSSGTEGALILLAAIGIVWTAVIDLIEGPQLQQLGLGLLITAVLALINLVLGLGLIRVGRRTNALVLVANGHHVLTDMWTSVGVLVGVGLVYLTGWLWLDPVVAIVMGLNILWTSGALMREAYGGLMETADPAVTEAILAVLDTARADGLIDGSHHVRHRRVNDHLWIEQHLLLPDDLRLVDAHDRATEVETRQQAAFPDSRVLVTSHLEPRSHDHPAAAPHDALTDSLAEVAAEQGRPSAS
ncbi:cation diffusion facilitator family transporter [Rubrivirga sp. IMCC45206]|uniref:cation diffusion facilitator family transporter n=1 Tax=Rubrivirga sp. IMCC45206 TaxID=3391614 RepID=UPI00399028B8